VGRAIARAIDRCSSRLVHLAPVLERNRVNRYVSLSLAWNFSSPTRSNTRKRAPEVTGEGAGLLTRTRKSADASALPSEMRDESRFRSLISCISNEHVQPGPLEHGIASGACTIDAPRTCTHVAPLLSARDLLQRAVPLGINARSRSARR